MTPPPVPHPLNPPLTQPSWHGIRDKGFLIWNDNTQPIKEPPSFKRIPWSSPKQKHKIQKYRKHILKEHQKQHFSLSHLCLLYMHHKGDICLQCRSIADATKHSDWSGSTPLPSNAGISINEMEKSVKVRSDAAAQGVWSRNTVSNECRTFYYGW